MNLSDFKSVERSIRCILKLGKNYLEKASKPSSMYIDVIICAFVGAVIFIGLGIWLIKSKSRGLGTFSTIVGVLMLCTDIYGLTTEVQTIHKESTPSLILASNCDSLFFKSDLNFDGIASEKKMVGYAKIHNTDYEVAKCIWNGKHTIKLIPLNKSGQALATVADYCRKNKVEKNDSLKLKVRKSYTTVKYKTKQGQITITAKVSNPDRLIKQIS